MHVRRYGTDMALRYSVPPYRTRVPAILESAK